MPKSVKPVTQNIGAIENLISDTPKILTAERYKQIVAAYFSLQTQITTYPSLLTKSGILGKEMLKLLSVLERVFEDNKMK